MSCRTLIVEDDTESSRMLDHLLRLTGCHCEFTQTLAGAEEIMERSIPDVLLLDLMLPDGLGLQLLEQIRRRQLPIRVAVTTAAQDHSLLNRMYQLEPDAVFPKPIDVTRLMQWIEQNRLGSNGIEQ